MLMIGPRKNSLSLCAQGHQQFSHTYLPIYSYGNNISLQTSFPYSDTENKLYVYFAYKTRLWKSLLKCHQQHKTLCDKCQQVTHTNVGTWDLQSKERQLAGPCPAWIEATAKNSLGNGIIRTATCTPEKNLNTLLK